MAPATAPTIARQMTAIASGEMFMAFVPRFDGRTI